MVKIAKQHLFANYIAICYCFGNIQGFITFWVLEFSEIEFSMVLEFHGPEYHRKNFPKNLKYIFSKNSSFWDLSFTTNSNFKKVIDTYIFLKQQQIANIFAKQWQQAIFAHIIASQEIVNTLSRERFALSSLRAPNKYLTMCIKSKGNKIKKFKFTNFGQYFLKVTTYCNWVANFWQK